ncbi:putative MFS-type transporter YhjX [Convolutriloba macropyga]|uniref:putative MFS-type transporter YhjX n=1 Tax=Convolutriloba macropyga TaxID=536237 RepID=UPI003F5288E9
MHLHNVSLRSVANTVRLNSLRHPLSSFSVIDKRSLSQTQTAKLSTQSLPEKTSFFDKYLGPKSVVANEKFKARWLMAVPPFLAHLCIGAPYGWSAVAGHLSKEYGFVCSAANDWTLAQVSLPMSVVFFLHGLSAAALGKWQMKVGPRVAMGLSGLCFGGGFALTGIGACTHSLPLIYLGFGVLSGTGLGLAYTPPIQALMTWFPDRKGVASGLTIMGFGSGSLLFVPSVNYLISKFAKMPTYLGQTLDYTLKDGKMFASLSDGSLAEVVYANAADLAKLSHKGLSEGYYIVGSGSTGATSALMVIGAVYSAAMLTAATLIRVPHPKYTEEMNKSMATVSTGTPVKVERNVHVDTVMRTPQFYGLAATLLCLGSGGMGLLSVCKPLMADTFGGLLPDIVTASFASSYILMLSVGNLGGRIGWGVLSDYVGRRKVFHMFTFGSLGLYLSFPFIVSQIAQTKSALPLAIFCGTTSLAVSFMGGVYAILPAYEADLFGPKYVGANHGRMLLASSAAAITGPSMILSLRNMGEKSAINGLLEKVDPAIFQQKFGVDISQADELIKAKTMTINKLMEIVPANVQDPTPFMYNTSFYSIAGLMSVAALAHYMVGPVNPEYYETEENIESKSITDEIPESEKLVDAADKKSS